MRSTRLVQQEGDRLTTRLLVQITAIVIRKIIAETKWTSPGVHRHACDRLSSVFKAAVQDAIIARNPVSSISRPKVAKKVVDPFTREEAEQIISHLYANLTGLVRIYACYFEFALFTGMRPGEIMTRRWKEVDFQGRGAHVCRVQVDREIHDRVKTKANRHVLLNDRAMRAL